MKPRWELNSKIKYWHVAYLAFLVIFIQQSFENTISDGAFGIYVYSYALLGIANSYKVRQKPPFSTNTNMPKENKKYGKT